MKVRRLERDLYNHIKEKKVVTCPDLCHTFGCGEMGIKSMFVDNAFTAIGMSDELCDALYELRDKGSIFEIACGIEFHDYLQDGDRPVDLPIASFKFPKYKYGYSGNSWLPAVFCSDAGVIDLVKLFFSELQEDDVAKYTSVLTDTRKMLLKETADRHMLSAFISQMLDGEYSKLWKIKCIERLKNINKKE